MHGLTIASTWITFLAIVAAIILYVIAAQYSMKDAPTDAEKAKARQLGMAGFWVLVVGGIFGLIGAISSSCKSGLGKSLDSLRRQLMDCEARGGGGSRFSSMAA